MWLRENCYIMPLPLWKDIESLPNLVLQMNLYTQQVFSLSRNVTVYLLLEPTPITVKMGDIKIVMTFPMFTSIVCNTVINKDLIKRSYRVAEGSWAKVGIVNPYVVYVSCKNLKASYLSLSADSVKGSPYICLDKPQVNLELGLKILNGGFVEVSHSEKIVGKNIDVVTSRDPLTSFLKNVIDTLRNFIEKAEDIVLNPVNIDRKLEVYRQDMLLIDGIPAIVKVGKGIIFALDLSSSLAQILYNLILLTVFNVPTD